MSAEALPTFARLQEYFGSISASPSHNATDGGASRRTEPPEEPFAQSSRNDDTAVVFAIIKSKVGQQFVELGDRSNPFDGADKSAIDQTLCNIVQKFTKDWRQIGRIVRSTRHGSRNDEKANRESYWKLTISKSFDLDLPDGDFSALEAEAKALVHQSRFPAPEPISETEWIMSNVSPAAIIANMLYQDVGIWIAQGGLGKTTTLLWMAIHIALGIDFCDRTITRPGRVVILTGEDTREILVARLRLIFDAMFPHGTMDEAVRRSYMETVRDAVRIIDVSQNIQRLTTVERDVVRVDTEAVDCLIDIVSPLEPTLLIVDPAISFGVGEARINDAEQGLIEAGRRFRNVLKCAVLYVHHTGKAQARSKEVDQYSGRGGSAFADGARMVFVTIGMKPADWKDAVGTELDIDNEAFRVSFEKLSYARHQAPIYIRRNGYLFRHEEPIISSDDARDAEDDNKLHAFLSSEYAASRTFSRNKLEDKNCSRDLVYGAALLV